MTSSKPDYPTYEFVPTAVVSNGQTLAKQYKQDGTVFTDISLPDESVKRKNKLQNLLDEYENSINTFSPELEAQFDSISSARKNSALKNFESLYEPSVRNAREDYFSRLGTLDSTAYLDRFNELEKTKAQAYADIANDYEANLEELKNNELSRRYNYLNYLNNSLNTINNQNNAYLSAVSSLSSSYTNNYNNYLQSLYSRGASNNNWFGDIFGTVANVTKSATSFI